MPSTDYYKVLGVSRTATENEIRKAYKKIARECHPDAKPGDQAAADRFKQAAQAYEVLGDAEKRKKYDQYGDAWEHVGRGGGAPFSGGGSQGGTFEFDLENLFGGRGDFGGVFGGRGRKRAQRGGDLQTELAIPFTTAALGGQQDLLLATGASHERLAVKIPSGVQDGDVIRLRGQGQAGVHGGAAGDLLVTIRVAPHPYFRREQDHVLVEAPVTFSEAALGARIDVPTLSEGLVSLKIPPGTSSGARLRMRGKGVSNERTRNQGDQYVVLKIISPSAVSPRARGLLEQLAEELPQNPREGLW